MTPLFKFGTEKKGFTIKNDTPGPGQYKIPCSMVDVASYSRSHGFEPIYKFI